MVSSGYIIRTQLPLYPPELPIHPDCEIVLLSDHPRENLFPLPFPMERALSRRSSRLKQ